MGMKLFPEDLLERVGGCGPFEAVAKRFYELSFADPILSVLYEDKAEPHYLMFCRWVFNQLGMTDEMDKRGGTKFINAMHRKAQNCPLRSEAPKEAGYVGAGFTKAQKNRWVRCQLQACEDFKLPKDFVRDYIHGLCVFMAVYGPFTESRAEDGPQTGKCPMSMVAQRSAEQVEMAKTHPNVPGYDLPGKLGDFEKVKIAA